MTFVGYIIFVLYMLSQDTNKVEPTILLASTIFLIVSSIFILFSNKKKKKSPQPLSHTAYLIIFTIGIGTGFFVSISMDYGYSLDFEKDGSEEIMLKIPLALGGYAGYLFFTFMAMAVSILYIPHINERLTNHNATAHIPYVGGATVGIGINLAHKISIHGIPTIIG